MNRDVLVCFDDGSSTTITNAETCSVNVEGRYASVEKNGHRVLFNFDKVKYIGYAEDINAR